MCHFATIVSASNFTAFATSLWALTSSQLFSPHFSFLSSGNWKALNTISWKLKLLWHLVQYKISKHVKTLEIEQYTKTYNDTYLLLIHWPCLYISLASVDYWKHYKSLLIVAERTTDNWIFWSFPNNLYANISSVYFSCWKGN